MRSTFTLIIFFLCLTLKSQHYAIAVVEGRDTVPMFYLESVVVTTDFIFKNQTDKIKWSKIKTRVKKVYPYVVLSQIKLSEMKQRISLSKSKKEEKLIVEKYEKEIREEFSQEIKDLSFEEGRILLKLLNRNTNQTAYQILKDFRGGFQAIIGQGLARVFGQNLKSEYDPIEDIMLERAVRMCESGDL